MISSNNSVWVVTGGNRGIGLGFVKALLARPSVTIIATVRNDQARTALEDATMDLVKGDGAILRIVRLDFTTALSPDQISKLFDLDHVDVLINNAAASYKSYPVLEIPTDDLRSAFEINTISPLTVVQGLWPLLQKSSAPKVVNVSSSVGCINYHEVVAGAYGPSKAALNWLTRALHLQNKNLVAFALHPGFVNTEMGESAATEWGFPHAMLEGVEEAVKGSLGIIDSATRESVSGKFISSKGQELPW
ncbi:ketoreductase [Fusarium subglutinans]|uniref:Ketoreductase n=1 Tax=Gibberella subglutinans TaxID=42677 RepID=A0A8H5KTM3_GIBSU|nr:ketoreductase [Fusarium subglutinans]KAF5578381.1 ketoreductase [Fusarium subglutinans]